MLITFMIPMFLAFGSPAVSRAVAEGQASQKRLETLLTQWEKAERRGQGCSQGHSVYRR